MTNVALIVLDTLRKDAFDQHFGWLPGTVYENAWSTSHWTVPAHASLFTGEYGSAVPATKKSPTLPSTVEPLPAQLQRRGYTTRAFSGNAFVSWKFGFDAGFDQFEGSWRVRQIPAEDVFDFDLFLAKHAESGIKRFPLAVWEVLKSDCDTLASLRHGARLKLNDYVDPRREYDDDGAAELRDLLRETKFGDKEFFFANLVEPHWPYDAPDAYKRVETPELRWLDATLGDEYDDPDQLRTAYADEVRYLADVYEEIFQLLTDTFDVIFTCSDHGESLGEDGAWQHWYGIPPEVVNIPLSVYGPDHDFPPTDDPVSLLDVHATVATLTGLDVDSKGTDLRDVPMFDETPRVGVEYHGLAAQHIEGMHARGYDPEPYDVPLWGVAGADGYGRQTFDRYEGPPELETLVEAFEASRPDFDLKSDEENLDSETIQQLQDLGYA